MAIPALSSKKRPAASSLGAPPLSPWEEELRAGKCPIILPIQSPPPPPDSEQDDVETFVPRDAIFPSKSVDIDALYATEVRVDAFSWGIDWIGLHPIRPFIPSHPCVRARR